MPDDLALHLHRFVPGTAPLAVLALHGTGGDENDLLALAAHLAPGAAVLSPRGNVSEQGMARFFRRLEPGVFDEADVRRRAADLARFVTAARQHYPVAAAPLLAVGYSNGANIAAALLLLHPEVLAGAVLLRPMVPLWSETLPDLRQRPVWIGSGRHDPLVPPAGTSALVEILRRAGAEVTWHEQEADHGLQRDELDLARRWVAGGRFDPAART